MSSRPRSWSLWTTIAVMPFEVENTQYGVSGVTSTFGASPVIRRAVAVRVADRAVEHDPAMAAQAQLHRRVDPAAVEIAHRVPDPLDRPLAEAILGRVLVADRGDRVEVPRDVNPPQRIAGQTADAESPARARASLGLPEHPRGRADPPRVLDQFGEHVGRRPLEPDEHVGRGVVVGVMKNTSGS